MHSAMWMLIVAVLLVFIHVIFANEPSQCEITKWRWPEDFSLYHTEIPFNNTIIDYTDMKCWPIRPKTFVKTGRSFCWKKKSTDYFPMHITLTPQDFTRQNMDCIALKEPSDWLYTTRYLCMAKHLQRKFKFTWVHDPKSLDVMQSTSPCIQFESPNGAGGWDDNKLCAEMSGVIVQSDCTVCKHIVTIS